jgi:hypothetical protein
MQAIWRFFSARSNPEVETMSGTKVKTGPQPVVTKEALEMRRKADEMLAHAQEVYEGAMAVSEHLEVEQAKDVIAEALLATKRGKAR